jgi:hypothetical protein
MAAGARGGISGVGEHGGVLDSGPRGVGGQRIGSAAGRYAGVSPSARADEDGSTGLPMDPTPAQLRTAAGGLPARGGDLHAAHAGPGQRESGGRTRGLGAAHAEEPGADECARASGGSRPDGSHGHGPGAGYRERGAGCTTVGEVARSALPEKRGRNRRAVNGGIGGTIICSAWGKL